MKRTLLIVLSFFVFADCLAQMVPTQAGIFLYFDPAVIKKNKVKHLFITQHEKHKQGKKIKVSRMFNKAEVLFDTNGRAVSTVYLWKGGSDTIKMHEKFVLPKNGVVVREEVAANKNKTFWIERGNEQERIIFDPSGNEILNEMVIKPVESLAYIHRFEYTYDSLDRVTTSAFTKLDIKWNYARKEWDTVPAKKEIEKYIYEKGSLTRIESHPDPGSKDPDGGWLFYYTPQGILTKVETSNDLTFENPVKGLLLISTKEKSQSTLPTLATPQ